MNSMSERIAVLENRADSTEALIKDLMPKIESAVKDIHDIKLSFVENKSHLKSFISGATAVIVLIVLGLKEGVIKLVEIFRVG